MKRAFKILIGTALIASFIASGCGEAEQSDKTINAKAYYFPYHSFFEPRVYIYENVDNPSDKSIWYMQTYLKDGDTAMLTDVFDETYANWEYDVEILTDKGAELEEFRLMTAPSDDGTQDTLTDVVGEPHLYIWNWAVEQKIKYNTTAKGHDSYDSFNKVRQLLKPVQETYRGKKLKH